MNTIVLHFDKADTRIAGNPYGKEVFRTQVKDKIDYNDKNVIIFPDEVKRVASSFTQGFFSEIINSVGYSKFLELVDVQAGSEALKNQIMEDLLY